MSGKSDHNDDRYKSSSYSHIFYPHDLLSCTERSYLIGFNTTGLNCSICCAVSKGLFHNTYGLLEEALHLERMMAFNRKYIEYMGSAPVILGEWLPEGTQEYESSNRRFLLRNIWVTLSVAASSSSGTGGEKAVLTNVFSCNNVYDCSHYQLVCYQKCNTDRVVLLLNLRNIAKVAGTGGDQDCEASADMSACDDGSELGSSAERPHSRSSAPVDPGSGGSAAVPRDGCSRHTFNSGSVAAEIGSGDSAAAARSLGRPPIPPPIRVNAPTPPPLVRLRPKPAREPAASRLTLLQLTQLQQLLAHELKCCLNEQLYLSTTGARVARSNIIAGSSVRVLLLETTVSLCHGALAACCVPIDFLSSCMNWPIFLALAETYSSLIVVLQQLSFVVCHLSARVGACNHYYGLQVGLLGAEESDGLFQRIRARYDTWTFVTNVWIDISLGLVLSWIISTHYDNILHTLKYTCDVTQSHLILGTVEWFNQSPFGVKLNTVATRFISDLVAECFVQFEYVYLASMNVSMGYIIRGVQVFGAIGLSAQFMLIADMLRLATLHLKFTALCLGLIVSLSTSVLTTIVLFFQGRKRNPLRGCRVDSAPDQDSEHLLIATLVFSCTVFITPTCLTFYAFFGGLQLCIQLITMVLWQASLLLQHWPWFLLWHRVREPSSLVNGANFLFCCGTGLGSTRRWGQLTMKYRDMAYRDIFELLGRYFYAVYFYAFAAVFDYAKRPDSLRGWIACYGGYVLYLLVGADYQLLTSMCAEFESAASTVDASTSSGRNTPSAGKALAQEAKSDSNGALPLRVQNEKLLASWTMSVEQQLAFRRRTELSLSFAYVLTQFAYLSAAVLAVVYYLYVYCGVGYKLF